MANQTWEEQRNANGVLQKLTAKLSEGKEVNVTLVPKTKLVYMHLNDYSKAYKNGSFDKSLKKSVSLSVPETMILRSLMATVDPKISELISTCVQPQGRKRKHPGEDSGAEGLANQFNVGLQPLPPQYDYEAANQQQQQQQYYTVPQYQQAKQPHLQKQPLANNTPYSVQQQYQQPAQQYQQTVQPTYQDAVYGQSAMAYDPETLANPFDYINYS